MSLLAVRHGETEMNSKEGERTRGWLPVPLTVAGMKAVIRTAKHLSQFDFSPTTIHCSDLIRAVQTAEELAHVFEVPLQPTEQLRDWNIGEYAGQEIKRILDDLHSYMSRKEDAPPAGEPYQAFLDRAIPYLRRLVASPEVEIIVTHNRVMTLIEALIKGGGKEPDEATLKGKGPVDPAGYLLVGPDWRVHLSSAQFKPVSRNSIKGVKTLARLGM